MLAVKVKTVSQSVSYFTVPPRAHPSTGSQSGSATPGLTQVPSTRQVKSSQVKSIHKQQTTIRKPIECAPEASSGGREWAEMTGGVHLEATRH